MEPAKLPEGQDSRVFTFEVTAELKNNNAVNPVTERFTVYQLKEPVEWKVVANTVHPYELRQNGGYEVVVAHDATGVWPKIETTPSSLIWWFSRGEAGAEDTWLTNLATWYGKKIESVATTYLDGLEFTLQPNTGLGRRSVTVQVESNTPGLSPREANLKITQKGRPLTLEPTVAEHTGGGTIVKQSDPEGGNPGIYLLDHGYGAAGGAYTLAMKSNTNWYWYWNTDDGQQVHEANMGLVAPDWTAKPDDRVPTTDHPDNGKSEHTWTEVATFTVPDFDRGDTAFDESQTDQEQPDVPLGGERTVVRELRNVHPELTADDMEENARQLHIRRELPAHTHIIEWPWADMTSLNWAMENNKYDDARFRFGTNATGKLTLTTGFDLSEQAQPNSEKTYTSTMGYDIFKQKFADMTKVPVTAESEADDPVFYKLRFTGRTANDAGTANKDVDEKRIYYTGTQMNVPLRNMETGQHYLSSDAHTLKLDFSNSYFNRVKVRVKAVLVNTDGTKDGVDDYFTTLNSTELALAKEKHLYPTTDWDKGVAFESGDASKTIEFALEENNHKNMMYKVVVEYARHKGNGTYEDQWQELDKLVIYQDGKPCDGSDVIWKYNPVDWPAILSNEYHVSSPPSVPGPEIIGTTNGKWIYATPWGNNMNSTVWGNWNTSFSSASRAKSVRADVTGPSTLQMKHTGGVTSYIFFVLIHRYKYNRYVLYQQPVTKSVTKYALNNDPFQTTIYQYMHVWNTTQSSFLFSQNSNMVLDGQIGGQDIEITTTSVKSAVYLYNDWEFSVQVGFSTALVGLGYTGGFTERISEADKNTLFANTPGEIKHWTWDNVPYLQFDAKLPIFKRKIETALNLCYRTPYTNDTINEMRPQEQK